MNLTNLKNTSYKRLYIVCQKNIFVIISDKIENNEQQLLKKLTLQLNNVPNYMQTKIQFETVTIKKIKNYVFAIGRFQIVNTTDDQVKKIVSLLQSLSFRQKENKRFKTRNHFTITTQCAFY